MVIKLTLTIEDIDVEVAEFNLITSDNIDNNLAIWEKDDQAPTGPDYALSLETQIINEELKRIEITKKGSKVLSTDDEIQELKIKGLERAKKFNWNKTIEIVENTINNSFANKY